MRILSNPSECCTVKLFRAPTKTLLHLYESTQDPTYLPVLYINRTSSSVSFYMQYIIAFAFRRFVCLQYGHLHLQEGQRVATTSRTAREHQRLPMLPIQSTEKSQPRFHSFTASYEEPALWKEIRHEQRMAGPRLGPRRKHSHRQCLRRKHETVHIVSISCRRTASCDQRQCRTCLPMTWP